MTDIDVDDYFAMKAAEEKAAREYGDKIAELRPRLLAYNGSFEFLLEMRDRANDNYLFTPRQIDAIERSLDKWDERQAEAAAPRNVEPVIGDKVPFGTTRHAVTNAEGKLTFIRLDKVEKGNWAGWVFVKGIAGPEEFRVGSQKPDGSYKGQWESLLTEINEDPRTTIARYGKEIGACGICGLRLTDEVSRELGIGPICLKKF